jgi:membrane dipeptidase
MEEISERTEGGDFDYVRAREGGLDALFMSIYTPPSSEDDGTSRALADSLIDMVEGLVIKWPSEFALAATTADVKRVRDEGAIAFLLGMENGSPIEGNLRNISYFYNRGVRYITLAHAKDNHICDSSYDDSRTSNGLSPFGRTVVAEMNRVGIMIDVSHVSDDAFYQIIELSKAPVIASHSGCRRFTPGWERNMSDHMIEKLAENGGVIHINFGTTFVSDEHRRRHDEGRDKAREFARERGLETSDTLVKEFRKKYYEKNPVGYADVSDVVDHINHVVELVGIDHVGFGSDFDGLGDSLPTGLKDVSHYPNLIYLLLKAGYSESDIRNICSGNLFRVLDRVEHVASELSAVR